MAGAWAEMVPLLLVHMMDGIFRALLSSISHEPIDERKSHLSIPSTRPPRLNLFQDPSTEQGLPRAFGPHHLCTPRGLAPSPTVVPIPPNTHSGLVLHVDPRQVTHTDLSPNPPPALSPPSPVSSDSVPISLVFQSAKKTGSPLDISCPPSPGLFNFALPRQADLYARGIHL